MLVSGKFIALSRADGDYKNPDLPLVIWFNIDNIIALECYENYYHLILAEEHQFDISTDAAVKLIEYMRKERDDKVRAFFDNISDDDKAKVRGYIEKIIKKGEPCTEE